MDRLSALIIPLALFACDKDQAKPPPSRTETGAVAAKQGETSQEFCDHYFAGDTGPVITFPDLVGGPPPAQAAGHWRWLNLWATWCKPCVDELPRIVKWHDKLAGSHPVDLAFVSVDDNDADVAEFRQKHLDAPATARLSDAAKQTAWITALGLDAGSPIPIHVFAAPSGHIRCARAGSVRDRDFAAIEHMLAE